MDILERLDAGGHEQVLWCSDRRSGLRAVVAIHSTALGPALGGTRFRPYADGGEALVDVLRLSRAMTYKMAISSLDLGGGKAVIVGDPRSLRSEPLLRAYARCIDSLGGRYITAEDVGTTQADMDLLRTETPHVTGTSEALGGSGDPSLATADGVLAAMGAVAEHLWSTSSLEGRRVVVAGVGKVGGALVAHLVAAGATVTVADIDGGRVAAMVAHHGVTAVPVAEAHTVACDVFAPCALGAVLTERTVGELRCAAVCGSANNQLAEPTDAERLADAGVLYAPDYVVNAGGVINIATELDAGGYDRARAAESVKGVGTTTAWVLRLAVDKGITPAEAADRIVERRLAEAATASDTADRGDEHPSSRGEATRDHARAG